MFRLPLRILVVVVVFLVANCLGKTIVPREVSGAPEKRPSDSVTGRRRGGAFGQPGLGGSYPAPPPKEDLIRRPAPVSDLTEPSLEENERNDVSERRMPDEGFFPGMGGIRDAVEEEDGTDRREIPDIDIDIGQRKDQEEAKDSDNLPDYLNDGNGKDGDRLEDESNVPKKDEDDERPKDDDVNNPEDEGNNKPPEDEKDGDNPDVVTDISSDENFSVTPEGFIVDDTFFSFRQVSKYFQRLERALELFFRETMDELPLLNGTYANTTEEEIDINGHMYRVVKSLIKNWGRNNSVYIETLSPISDSNASQVLKDLKL